MKTCRACLTANDSRKKRCGACGRKLPVKRRPKHLQALTLPYEAFVEANGGYDGCWVCRELGERRDSKLHRDHWHSGPKAGLPRGILCVFHNMSLGPRYTVELTAALARYLAKDAA